MSFNFQRGDLCGVKFQATDNKGNPLQGLTAVNVTGWTMDLTKALFDVTNTGLAGQGTGRIAGKPDIDGSFNYDYDADAPATFGPPNMKAGQNGFLQFFVTPTQAFQVPVIVEKEHYENPGMMSQIKGSVSVKMNALLGPIVYPGFP